MKIRRAERKDLRQMLEVHRRSVHELGASDYDAATLEAWAPPIDDDRIERWGEQNFGDDSSIVAFVAVERDGPEQRVLGFSSVDPSESHLMALYVDPDVAQRGLGTALLRQAEWAAAQEGAERLELESSLNARDFYIDQGYEVVGRGATEVGDGQELEHVRMEKELPGPGL